MTHSPTGGDSGWPSGEPHAALQEFSATERWVGSDAGPAPSCARSQDPTYVVETDTRSGMHEVVAIGHPGSAPPSEDEQTVLRSAVRALLDLTGHETGRARTEVLLTGRGPQVLSCSLDSGEGAGKGTEQ